MTLSWFFIWVFLLCLCFFFLETQGRLNIHAEPNHLHTISRISFPPSSSPDEAAISPSYSVGSVNNAANDFNVRSFGAVGNGVKDDTQAFKMAWDSACQEEKPAKVLVPEGYSFMIQSTIFTGPCKSAITFQIDGTVMTPDGPKSWPKNNSKRQWLVFYRIDGMAMQGSGVIDGRGEKWWNLPCKAHKNGIDETENSGPCESPVAIRFFMSSNLTVQGLIVKNSPQFHFRFDGCQNVYVDSLTIKAPGRSPNTDGIHIGNTNNVKIYNSLISNGDDCVSIGSGSYNVDIRNITCGPGHGIRYKSPVLIQGCSVLIQGGSVLKQSYPVFELSEILLTQESSFLSGSIGSLGNHNSRACVSDITVSDSFIKNSDNGVRIKTWQGGSGDVSRVSFQNIQMDNVRNPIIVDQYYCLTKKCQNQTSAVYVSNILYSNIKGTYDVRSPPVHFACSDSVPCTNLTLSEVELIPAGGKLIPEPVCWSAYGTIQAQIIPPVLCLLEGSPEIMQQSEVLC